jgi:hypothetical protein
LLSVGVTLKRVHVASARCFIALDEIMPRSGCITSYGPGIWFRRLRPDIRFDVSTAMIYNSKDRSIPLPLLRRGGRRHRVSISARRLRASCGHITEFIECAVAARAVQAEALRHIQVGLPQQDENPITEPRPKRPRGSGRPRRGAPRPNRPHVTRNTSGSRRVTFAPQLVHYPPDKPLQYTTPKQEPLETVLHETTEFPPGLRH